MEIKTEKFLPFNLQFFAEADTGGGQKTGGDESGDGQTSDGKEKADKQTDDEHMIPKSRFDQVNDNYKSLKSELDELKDEKSKAERQRQEQEETDAKQRGEYENLYTTAKSDLETVQSEKQAVDERVEALEGVITGLLDSKLEGIDEEYHDLIPEGLTPEAKLTWVNNAEQKGLFGSKQAQEPLGKQTNPKDEKSVDTDKMNPVELMMSGYGK